MSRRVDASDDKCRATDPFVSRTSTVHPTAEDRDSMLRARPPPATDRGIVGPDDRMTFAPPPRLEPRHCSSRYLPLLDKEPVRFVEDGEKHELEGRVSSNSSSSNRRKNIYVCRDGQMDEFGCIAIFVAKIGKQSGSRPSGASASTHTHTHKH